MKNPILISLLLLCFLSTTISAQTTRGSWLIGGMVTGSYQNNTGYYGNKLKTLSIDLTPQAGYFFFDRFMAGIMVDLYSAKMKSQNIIVDANGAVLDETLTSTSRLMGIGPFVRYYIPISKIFVVTEAGYLPQWGRNEGLQFDMPSGYPVTRVTKYQQHYYSAGIGPAMFIGSNASVELLVHYKRTNSTYSGLESDTNQFYVSAGLQFYIPRKE